MSVDQSSTIKPTLEQKELPPAPEVKQLPPPGKKHSRAAQVLTWALVLAALAGLGLWARRALEKPKQTARPTPPPTPVSFATARTGDIPVYLNGLGSVTAYYTVTVRTRIDGQLMRVAVKEGQPVAKGQLLAEIDARPYQVQLEQAEGQLARDEALLRNARVDLERYQLLLKQDAIPKQQLDTQAATVAQYEGVVKADQGTADAAKLQILYTRITASTSGRIGLRAVDPGNMVHAADPNGLLVITQVQPITVVFTIPEDNLPPVVRKLRAGSRLRVDAFARDNTTKLSTGVLETIDNQIDPQTGTSKLKAIFANTDNMLFPQQFVNARLLLDTLHDKVLIPTASIQRGQQGTFVYLIRPDDTVEIRKVDLGITEGEDTVAEDGLAAGDRVVTEGSDKLQTGSKVMIAGQGRRGARGGARTPGAAQGAAQGPGGTGHKGGGAHGGGPGGAHRGDQSQ